ncbi:phosphoribosyltransferase [Nocardia goodfellowii]|uniref:Phosphoribosyl transferase n=1 Tax=Nocardia goodfellowii TaxID=882446 RepID=A0ABS4QRU5_9NOCA|nr:phosphoribosyltransferase family protein [Nocardia goodfellowii]MBP2194437.1 putative phosphoribosyl transferase [Nocardia goodfellowii]
MPFFDRRDAGRRLVERLRAFRGDDVVVLAVPRGGAEVAFEVATALRVPMDVAVVRKLGVPFQPPLVFGAIAEDQVRIIDDDTVVRAFVSEKERRQVLLTEREVLARKAIVYRCGRPRLPLAGRTALIVDDGVTTGATAQAACASARAQGAIRVVYAVPVGPCRPIRQLATLVDNVVCLETPELFHSIGQWYRDFHEVDDKQVVDLLDRANNRWLQTRSLGTGPPGAAWPSRPHAR